MCALFSLFFPIMVKTSKNGFLIESEVEIPAARMGSNVYPFDELEVGESFFVPWKTASEMCVHYAQYKGTSLKFTARTIKSDGGVRVWRTA